MAASWRRQLVTAALHFHPVFKCLCLSLFGSVLFLCISGCVITESGFLFLLAFSWNYHQEVLVLFVIIILKCMFLIRNWSCLILIISVWISSPVGTMETRCLYARNAERISSIFHACAHLPDWDDACGMSGIRRFSDSFQSEAQWQTPTRDGACALGKSFLEHEISFPSEQCGRQWQMSLAIC